MYSNLTKEEKKKIRERFKKTSKGENVLQPLNRLLLEGIFLIGCSIVIVGATIIFKYSWWLYFTAVVILLFGIFFITAQQIIRVKNYDNYIKYLKKKKSNTKTSKKRLTKKK